MTSGDKFSLASAYFTAVILGLFTIFVAVLSLCLSRRRTNWQKVKARHRRAGNLLEFFLLVQTQNSEQRRQENLLQRAFETSSSKRDESALGGSNPRLMDVSLGKRDESLLGLSSPQLRENSVSGSSFSLRLKPVEAPDDVLITERPLLSNSGEEEVKI